MSVIIRLQNLPWNANALDIRRFFQGLSIPDGGVHIIGGEKGDAFIAFSTDEDARQAMMSDGGRINGFAVKLLLSSKTEMQNVIAAAKGGPPPPLPTPAVGLALGQQKPPVASFYERPPMIPPVGGAPVQFVGAPHVGGDVTGSGQGLRSSTGLGNLPPGPYGGYLGGSSYPGLGGQVVAQPPPIAGVAVIGINEPPRALPAAPVVQPAARSVYETRAPMPGSLQQPPMAPMNPGLRTGPPSLPAVGAWTSPPQEFSRSADIQRNQPPGFNATFVPGPGREPMRADAGRIDANYQRNGQAYGAPADSGRSFADSGRNFVSGFEPGRNLGPPPVDLGRGNLGRVDGGMPLNRPEERREPSRFVGDPPRWSDREANGSGQGQSGNGRLFGGRDVDNGPRREFQRPEADRGFPPADRWLENRGREMDRGPGAVPLRRPGMTGAPDDRRDRSPMFPDNSRFPSDRGDTNIGRYPEDRERGDARPDYGRPEPGFREPGPGPPQRTMMEEPPMRRLPPPPEQRWMDDRRGFGPTGSRPDVRPISPPRDQRFPGPVGFPPRDDPWRDGRPMDGGPRRGEREMGPPRDLSIRVENIPQSFNYREVRRFFNSVEIPRDGIKLINDHAGMRTGLAFIQVADKHSLHMAINMSGRMAEGRMVSVRRCSDQEFDMAMDGKPPRSFNRSRSPHRRAGGAEQFNVSHFVLKKLPLKTEKDDIRKFFAKFKIASDGGPFLELAFDKTPTGNALIAMEEKEGKVLALNRNELNGARVDVIKIAYHEFAERSRRARQCDRDAEKDPKPTASTSSSAVKKTDAKDTKSKESDRAAAAAQEEDGRQSGGAGGDADQRVCCIELRGIPYTASPAMLQDFFREVEIPVESIHIVYNREHRATGLAYVEFNSIADQKRALEKDKQYMGHRFVEIRAMGRTAMVEEFNRQAQKFGGTPLGMPSKPGAADRSQPDGPRVMVSMQNLHYDTQLEDILDFFSGYHPIVDSIKLQYKDGQPTGDGLIEFESLPEAESALRTKNRHALLGKPIALGWPKN